MTADAASTSKIRAGTCSRSSLAPTGAASWHLHAILVRRPDRSQEIESRDALRRARAELFGGTRCVAGVLDPSAAELLIEVDQSLGTESIALSKLFGAGSFAWSFVPSITQPIFQGGRLQASLDLAELQKESAIAQYEKAIQTAFREVADGLAARGTYDDEIAALEHYVVAYQASLDLSLMHFRNGVDSYLDVLTAQTNLYAAQQALVLARLNRLTNSAGQADRRKERCARRAD